MLSLFKAKKNFFVRNSFKNNNNNFNGSFRLNILIFYCFFLPTSLFIIIIIIFFFVFLLFIVLKNKSENRKENRIPFKSLKKSLLLKHLSSVLIRLHYYSSFNKKKHKNQTNIVYIRKQKQILY